MISKYTTNIQIFSDICFNLNSNFIVGMTFETIPRTECTEYELYYKNDQPPTDMFSDLLLLRSIKYKGSQVFLVKCRSTIDSTKNQRKYLNVIFNNF